jgi:hypothetical protein
MRARCRTIRWIMATRIIVSLVRVQSSSSFDKRRQRPTHAQFRSTIYRLGRRREP